ncbi:Hsp70 protein-domain-containing protein [Aspergillus pseudodeflectus]|uniref:Hsp70 protein-domain-containing protein n=1 Tax=Aspergillus pseudodeflectus TaxID=176178 RepID=A0ABR4JA90_9EURO
MPNCLSILCAADLAQMRRTRTHRSNRILTRPSLLSIIFLTLLFALSARACVGNTPDESSEKIIGIHLGRTESRVGGVKDGRIVVFPEGEGGYDPARIPSLVSLTEKGLVVGEEARSAGGPDLFKAVLEIGDYIPTPENPNPSPKQPPQTGIEFVLDKTSHPAVQVTLNNATHTISPPAIYATLLTSLRSIAEDSLGAGITGAVISLPRGATDRDRSFIGRAGALIGLPIVRQQNETTSTILALGLDEESYGTDRYALMFDLDGDAEEMHLRLVEIDMGVVDTIAAHSVAEIAGSIGDAEYMDDAVAEDLSAILKTEAMGSVGSLVNAALARSGQRAIDELLRKANFTRNEITDLIFTGDAAFYPKMQDSIEAYLTRAHVQSAAGDGTSTGARNEINVANSMTLSAAPIWGAALTAYRMMVEDWVPCCCSTRRPPIEVSVGGGGDVVEVIPACQDVPILLSEVVEGKCDDDDSGQTKIQVVMRDVPSVDYHAQFELGDAYVANETISDILVAEFNLPTACDPDTPVAIEIEMLLSRQMELRVKATDRKSNESRLLTVPYLNSECGAKGRDAPRQYSLEIAAPAGSSLEAEYQRDLRGLVGGSSGQKKVLARRAE